MVEARDIIAKALVGCLSELTPYSETVDAIIAALTAAGWTLAPPGSRVVPEGGVDAPAYDKICIPPDIHEFGARHHLPHFGAATYRNGYMDGFRAALRALAEAKP